MEGEQAVVNPMVKVFNIETSTWRIISTNFWAVILLLWKFTTLVAKS